MLSLKVKKSSIWFYSVLFLVVCYAMLENTSLAIPAFTAYRRPMLILAFVLVLPRIKLLLIKMQTREYLPSILCWVCLVSLLLLSAAHNSGRYADQSPYYATFNLILYLTVLLIFMIYTAEYGMVKNMFRFLSAFSIVLVIITDAIILTGAVTYQASGFEAYFVGTKFSVSYLHIYCLAFYLLQKNNPLQYIRKHYGILLIYLAAIVWITIRVDCNTGMLGSIMLLFLIWLCCTFRNIYNVMTTKRAIIIMFILSVVIAFAFELLVQYPFIKHIIVDVLNRKLTLTGRTDIYGSFIIKMSTEWKYGFGYGAAYRTSMDLFQYADTQNAILEWVLQVGVGATVVMLMFFTCIYGRISYLEKKYDYIPLVALIIVFIILGTVEITFSMNFVLWFFILYATVHEKKEELQ